MKRNLFFVRILTILAIKCVSVYSDGEGCGGPASTIIATKDSESCGYGSNPKGPCNITTSSGTPVPGLSESLTVGHQGPILLQDSILIDELQHFDRERIPERVVHAKGAGAFGYFEVTHDITKFTRAVVFSEIGERTAVAVRFSNLNGGSGSADTVREPRGFAVKFYTQDGIWDLIGLSSPMFLIRDPMGFPSKTHSQKRNPVTNLEDPNAFWDFISLLPETTYQVLFVFSDQGIPDGYRYMEGHGIHSFKFVNKDGEVSYVRFHFIPDQGVKNLPSDVAAYLTGNDPDYAVRDLYTAIKNGTIPKWTMYIQIVTEEQAKSNKYVFDVTKILPTSEFPFIPVGKLVLNKNPTNYFADVEQLAFAPHNLIPGIEPSPDKLFAGRILSYSDTQMYRLGTNHLQLPVNCPYRAHVKNYQRDGPQTFYNQEGAPNYYPNSFNGPVSNPKGTLSTFHVDGMVSRYDTGNENNFEQATQFWTELNTGERTRLVQNIVASLKDAADFIQERAVNNFLQVDENFGNQISEGLEKAKMS